MPMRLLAPLVTTLALAGCGKKPDPAPTPEAAPRSEQDHAKVEAEIKALIPEAAGMPATMFEALGKGGAPPHPDDREFVKRGSLTFAVFCLAPSPILPPEAGEEFHFGAEQINPAKLAEPMAPAPGRDFATVIRADYITSFTCKVTDDTATGFVAFEVKNGYRGKVQYRAKRTDGKWAIEEFQMPNWGLKLTRVTNGEWSRTLEMPPPKSDERLKGDVAKLQGTWVLKTEQFVSNRVVSGQKVAEVYRSARDDRPPQTVTSTFALRFEKGAPVIVFFDRTRKEGEGNPEPFPRDAQFGYKLEGNTWIELTEEDGKWVEAGRWTRVKK
jgi:hypothetical protein